MRRQAEFLLFITTFIWGSTFVAMKLALMDVSPFVIIAVRFALACAIVLPIFHKEIFSLDWLVVKRGTLLGLFLSIGFFVQTYGLQWTTASKSAFITGMLVVFTPIAQILIERRPPKLGNIIGIVLVVIGLWFLTSPKGSAFNIGDGLTLIAAILFALYIVYLDVFTKLHNIGQLFFLQLAVTLTLALLGASVTGEFAFRPSTTTLGLILYLAIFATVISTFIQTKYQRETTPTRAALIFSLEPVIAASLVYMVLDERIGLLGVLGGGLIVIGVLVSQLSESLARLPIFARFRPAEEPEVADFLTEGSDGNPRRSE